MEIYMLVIKENIICQDSNIGFKFMKSQKLIWHKVNQ